LDIHPPPATLAATKTEDTNDGICDADCSLREAIAVANSGDFVIVPDGIYTLTLELLIAKDLVLSGAGADRTIIQADTEPGTANGFRVFQINGGDVSISGVTIRHGNGFGVGGGVTRQQHLDSKAL